MWERSKFWEWGQIGAVAAVLYAAVGSPPPGLRPIVGFGGALFLLLYYATGWWEQRRDREGDRSSNGTNSSGDSF
jgi:hypothetical protein